MPGLLMQQAGKGSLEGVATREEKAPRPGSKVRRWL